MKNILSEQKDKIMK